MSLDRIRRIFAACHSEDRPALITYVMGGDPSPKSSRALAVA